MADEQKIVVEVPSSNGHYSPVVSTAELSKLEEFKKGWRNAIAFPDNFTDLAFDLIASLTIPAPVLFAASSCRSLNCEWSHCLLPV